MNRDAQTYDLLVIGGGINGIGIARDAAGRGLSVLVVEKDDLAAHTSSWSSKLIHGGLRYLEQYQFRLVAEALAERRILLNMAGHLVWPARFVMPHVPELRPRWMIRAGLFLYDRLGGRADTLPASEGLKLSVPPWNEGLKPALTYGFCYSDCRVDDARLVVANAQDAVRYGAKVCTRTSLLKARREGGVWRAHLSDGSQATARSLVNAAGPWVKSMLNDCLAQPSTDNVRLVKGSHIVVPRLYSGSHAFILQNDDKRVVFMIPFEHSFTLVGTTDVPVDGDPQNPQASEDEVAYLCRAVNRYLAKPLMPTDVIWRYAGIRPLYDDGSNDPSAVTRDYTLRIDAAGNNPDGSAPVLSVFGGKLTTYRRLAEHALEKLAPFHPGLKPAWTAGSFLPGSEFAGGRDACKKAVRERYPALSARRLTILFRRYGTRVVELLGDARSESELGERFGDQFCERELAYLVRQEWVQEPEDALWRRTKAGLHLDQLQRSRVSTLLARLRDA